MSSKLYLEQYLDSNYFYYYFIFINPQNESFHVSKKSRVNVEKALKFKIVLLRCKIEH